MQTFFDELKNGSRNYRTIASLDSQIAQAYRGRCILELLQNAHDALRNAGSEDPRQVSFVLTTSPEPVLLVGNSGRPFRTRDFNGLCQLGQSPKDPNESVGNKGLGFRSVLEVSTCPEIWSTAPSGCDVSFCFHFDPAVSQKVAQAALELRENGRHVRSPFDPESPLVDWSEEQRRRFNRRLDDGQLNPADEARNYLSPYMIPLPAKGLPSEVERLLQAGHVTVVRLRLDGGRVGAQEAMKSVAEQLQELEVGSTIFLPNLEKLIIDIDGKRRTLTRAVDSDENVPGCHRTRRRKLSIESSTPASGDSAIHQYRVWTRDVGGDDDPEQARRIGDIVEHLPNRWPEVRQVTLGVAVEEAATPEQGVFVIFLPTEIASGTGAHINAPFYGSLDRRHIDFRDRYNEFLLESVLDLCLDAVTGLISGPPEDWRTRAVIDLLSSTDKVGGEQWCFMDRMHQRASERGSPLDEQALILCDDGWRVPGESRLMPAVPVDDNPISATLWRRHAEFAAASTALDERRDAVEALLTRLGGSAAPTDPEWAQTIAGIAARVKTRGIDVTWDAFLHSVVAVLPEDLRSQPRPGTPDPLATVRFLPDQDERLVGASDSVKLFFQPVRGVDDAADLVEEVPGSLKQRVAFLHRDVHTQEQGGPQRNTPVQKFLDGRFARGFRREELIRDIVVPTLPPLPVPHGGDEARRCSELFTWTLKLLGDDGPGRLLPLLMRLPVACHGGWRTMSDAVFGPGWEDRHGDDASSLADELPEIISTQLRARILLRPDDPRWGTPVRHRNEWFARVGLADGLRLYSLDETRFQMTQYNYELPSDAPTGTPQEIWDNWRESVREEAKPHHLSEFEYSLSGINLLPEIHHLETLSTTGRNAISRLVLASFAHWPVGWEKAAIRKRHGQSWSREINSPLSYCLATLPWLQEGTAVGQRLSDRWLVPASLLGGQGDRFQHLNPLSLELARKLEDEPKLKASLIALGLNVYPLDNEKIGPELLEALAAAWTAGRVPLRRFDVFLGQIRHGWRCLDPEKRLPEIFLVRTGQRTFWRREGDELADIYLPDNRDRTRTLLEHGKHVLAMLPDDANRMADAFLAETDVRRASTLEERFLIDGALWTGVADEIPLLEDSRYHWLPVPLLAIAAYGGVNPAGTTTQAWQDAENRLRRVHLLECEDITVQLVDGEDVVAESEPQTRWLPGNVMAVQGGVESSHGRLAPAAQALLGRQDLLKDLRLVLGALDGRESPTDEQIETALEHAEIDVESVEDVRVHWERDVSSLVERIRPVLALLGIPGDGFEAPGADIDSLTEWLSSNVPQWPARELLSAARQSEDDHAMGLAAWHTLGEVAQLPAWNAVLSQLGEPYVPVRNRRVCEQTSVHLESAKSFLCGLARHVALDTDMPELFHEIEAVSRSFAGDDAWPAQWWETPFRAVVDALRAGYAGIGVAGRHLEALEDVMTVDDLRAAFQARNMTTEPDPYQIARWNKDRLDEALSAVHDLHRTWAAVEAPDSTTSEPPAPSDDLDPRMYLCVLSTEELLERALRTIGDGGFAAACDGCVTIDEIRTRLGLDSEAVDAQRRERREREREEERQRRTFDVAGFRFEAGTASFGELMEHFNTLAAPVGPRASQDEFTRLAVPSHTGRSGGIRGGGNNSLSPGLRELVGIVGEIHAYRFLREEFGNDVVTPAAWVSEIRRRVLRPVPGEKPDVSDGHGFDFRFSDHRGSWYVEVKSTMGDDPQFDLGISEIEAAARLTHERGGRWRILRVRRALGVQPEFDWLPNPFREEFKNRFRLQRGGMQVSYVRENE